MRVPKSSDLVSAIEGAGYKIEEDVMDSTSLVVEIPVKVGEKVRTLKDVSMLEQLNMAAFMQNVWADNQVSCTVTFDPETEGKEIENALNFYQYQLKGISFLPKLDQIYP
jgi:ribonucleotide reductase alpha subunit